MAGEQLFAFRDILLSNHILNRCIYLRRDDSIDRAVGETQEAITDALLELIGEGVGELDGLVFDAEAANVDVISADGARSGGEVAVGDPPRGAL